MKRYEYMVDSNTGSWAAKPFEDWLHEKAERGWRFVTAFWTLHGELFCVFEREVEDEAT